MAVAFLVSLLIMLLSNPDRRFGRLLLGAAAIVMLESMLAALFTG